MSKILRFSLLLAFSAPVIGLPTNAQMMADPYGTIGHSILEAEQNRIYGKDKCYGLISSEWKYYQRKRAAGENYPDTKNVNLQRKYETKYGCPHLYEVDGTVNRVRGINDSGSFSSSSNSRSSSQLTSYKVQSLYESILSASEPSRSTGISLLCSNRRFGVSVRNNWNLSYSEFSLLKSKFGC